MPLRGWNPVLFTERRFLVPKFVMLTPRSTPSAYGDYSSLVTFCLSQLTPGILDCIRALPSESREGNNRCYDVRPDPEAVISHP